MGNAGGGYLSIVFYTFFWKNVWQGEKILRKINWNSYGKLVPQSTVS